MAPYDVESITVKPIDYLVHKQVQGEGGKASHGYAVIIFYNPLQIFQLVIYWQNFRCG